MNVDKQEMRERTETTPLTDGVFSSRVLMVNYFKQFTTNHGF